LDSIQSDSGLAAWCFAIRS